MAASEEFTFFAKYGISRKIIRVTELSDIFDRIKEAFIRDKSFPGNFIVQFKHKSLDEFVDLDDPQDLLERSDNCLSIVNDPTAQPYTEKGDERDRNSDSDSDFEETSSENSNDTLPVADDSENINSQESRCWPSFFLISDDIISSQVLERLKNRLFLNRRERSSLFGSIYDYCTQFTYYPAQHQYNIMVDAILLKWPHLKKEFKNDYDAKILWKLRLRTHFKNTRRRMPSIPAIRAKKRKRSIDSLNVNDDDNAVPLKSKKTSHTWGVPNFCPTYPAGETNDTMTVHALKLAKEYRVAKEKRNKPLVEKLLDITFSFRRKLVVEELHKISWLLDKFPILREEEQLLSEFKRISDFDIQSRINVGLSKYRDKMIHLRPTTDKKNLLVPIRSEFASCRNESGRIYLANCLSLLTIPFMVRESPLSLIDDGTSNQPRLRFQRQSDDDSLVLVDLVNSERIFILVEDEIILEVDNFVKAFILLVAIHYIFNLVYVSSLEATYTTIQKVFMDLCDGVKPIGKVINFVAKLNTL